MTADSHARAHSIRVLQVVLALNPGGTERLVLDLVRRLQQDVHSAVCCLDAAGAWGEDLRRDGVDVQVLARAPGFNPWLGRAIAHQARRHGISVIHCHQYSPFVYSCCARLWQPSLNVVFTEHGRLSDAPPSPKRRLANSVLGHVPRHVFAVSEDLKRHMLGEGFRANRVGVIYNGIDIGPLPAAADRDRARASLGVTDDTLVVATVARLDPVKSLETLLHAVATVKSHDRIQLLVIGDGSERQPLEAVAAALGLGDAVRFMGHRDDARALLAACDVYANSSISEGISLTILEGMAAGLPILATRVGGTPEIIDEDCGRLVPSRSPAALAAALHEFARNARLRHDLGRAGRARVESRFTIERMVREYREVYERLVTV